MVQQNVDVNVRVRNKQDIDNLNKSLGKSSQALGGLGTAAKVAAGALATIGAGRALKSFVDVGRSVENLRVRFKFLFGSATEGAKAFETLTEFAGNVPFSLDQIAAASGNLAVVSDDANALGKNLELAGNIAAVTGLDFQTAGEQLQRALSGGIGAADLLREKGVTALLGFKQGTKVTVEETAAALQRVFGPGGQFGNAAATLANTFDGVVSMVGDKMFNFQKTVGDEFVSALTRQFGDLNTFLSQNAETIDVYARALGITLANATVAAGNAAKFLKDNSEAVLKVLEILVALKLAAYFYGLATAIRTSAVAMTFLNKVTAKNPLIALGLKVAAGLTAIGAGFFAAKEGADALSDSIDNAVDEAKLQKLREAVGSIEDAMIIEDPAVAEAKKQKAKEQANQALIKKEQKFIESMGILGEDSLARSIRIEQERIARLEALRDADVENYEKYTDLITKVEEAGAKEREKIYKAEQEKRKKAHEQDLENIKRGKAYEVDMEGKTQQEKFEIIKTSGKSVLAQFATFNKKAFELNKKVAIAEAIINTLQGATKALAQGGIFGPILAATVIASGLAQVAAIRAQQYQGREIGGAVAKGQTYVVGESGPELFTPNATGSITPNNRFEEGAGGTTINFNISTVDARGFDELLQTRQDLIITLVNRGLTERGRPRLV